MATINTTCPQCSAPHARKLSLIHSAGLSTTETAINTVGTFNTIGRQQITTKGTTAGVQQTDASRRAAPPVVDEISTIGAKVKVTMMLLGMGCIIYGMFTGSSLVVVFGLVTCTLSFFVPTAAGADEVAEHLEKTKLQREAFEVWEKTFECGSCGHRFVP